MLSNYLRSLTMVRKQNPKYSFCGTCGVQILDQGGPRWRVAHILNVRTVEVVTSYGVT